MPYAEFLRQADIFYDLADERLNRFPMVCREEAYEKGDSVLKEKTAGDTLCLKIREADMMVGEQLLWRPGEEEK